MGKEIHELCDSCDFLASPLVKELDALRAFHRASVQVSVLEKIKTNKRIRIFQHNRLMAITLYMLAESVRGGSDPSE